MSRRRLPYRWSVLCGAAVQKRYAGPFQKDHEDGTRDDTAGMCAP